MSSLHPIMEPEEHECAVLELVPWPDSPKSHTMQAFNSIWRKQARSYSRSDCMLALRWRCMSQRSAFRRSAISAPCPGKLCRKLQHAAAAACCCPSSLSACARLLAAFLAPGSSSSAASQSCCSNETPSPAMPQLHGPTQHADLAAGLCPAGLHKTIIRHAMKRPERPPACSCASGERANASSEYQPSPHPVLQLAADEYGASLADLPAMHTTHPPPTFFPAAQLLCY